MSSSVNYTYTDVAKMIDHSLLNPALTIAANALRVAPTIAASTR